MKPTDLMLQRVILVLIIFLCSFSLAFAQGTETEPNDKCSNAQDFGAVALPFTVDGSLDTPPSTPDVDFFEFTGTPGAIVTVDLEGSDTGKGTLSDPLLGLFDSGCNQIDSDDDGGIGRNSRLRFTIPGDGVFILAATSFNDSDFSGDGSSNGSYQLTITPAATITIFTGTATGVGLGPNRGGIRIVGRFTFAGDIDLADPDTTVKIDNLFNEVGGSGEVVKNLPVTLSSPGNNNAHSAIFKTSLGIRPIAVMKIARHGADAFNFRLEVSQATIGVPSQCPPATDLTIDLTIEDGVNNPPLVVTTEKPWRCFGTGNRYMRTP